MSLLDFPEEETTEIHTDCPFCKGEYVKRGTTLGHSWPECKEFRQAEKPGDFLQLALIAEAQNPRKAAAR